MTDKNETVNGGDNWMWWPRDQTSAHQGTRGSSMCSLWESVSRGWSCGALLPHEGFLVLPRTEPLLLRLMTWSW